MMEKTEGLAVRDVERQTSPEREGLQEVLYYKDTSTNYEISEGFIDLQPDLGRGGNSDVGFWLDAADEGVGLSHRGVYVLHRNEDGQSFSCGFVETTGLNDDGIPEYAKPELFDDLPAELVEAHLLCEPLQIGEPSDLLGGMTVAKVGIKSKSAFGTYERGRWGENPIEKIIVAKKIIPSTKP